MRAAGLNPFNWQIVSTPELAAMFGVAVPNGFGCHLAAVIDEVGSGAGGCAAG